MSSAVVVVPLPVGDDDGADELCIFRVPIVVGRGMPYLPPATEDIPLDLIETKAFGSRVIYESFQCVHTDSA